VKVEVNRSVIMSDNVHLMNSIKIIALRSAIR